MTKTNIHKWVAILVSFLMIGTLFSMLPITNLTASAISCQKDGFDKSRYTLSGNMAEDVATIAKSQKGRTGAQFGYTEAWCDEFVADCIENAGADSSIVGHGGTVADFESIMRQKKGAVEVSSPQVGDLVFFTYSHVEIVTKVENGTVYCAGGNNGGTGNYKTNYCAGERKLYATARLYLRPNYKNINPKKWYENYECPDLGTDFYAYIINTQAWKMLTNESDNNIDIQSEIAQANQVWKFTRKDDGSYKIINCATSRALDSQGTSESGANVYTYEDSNNDPQSWYIYGESGAYYLRSKCTDWMFQAVLLKMVRMYKCIHTMVQVLKNFKFGNLILHLVYMFMELLEVLISLPLFGGQNQRIVLLIISEYGTEKFGKENHIKQFGI